jgi:signal transduction histidine kinase
MSRNVADYKSQVAAAIVRAQANLEDAVAALDRMPAFDTQSVALAAHALNNFLTVADGTIGFLSERLRDHPDPQVNAWLEGLAHATTLMTHTVSRLMNNSVRVESWLRLEDVNLGRLVHRVCMYYRGPAALKSIEIDFRAADDVPLVRGDPVLVAAILDNLLSNAVKYSPAGNRIRVHVYPERDGAACSVRDEGPGLSAQDQKRLFLPGMRLSPVPSAGEPSYGYGLALAKRFVDQLGGEIRCASVEGQGATFTVWFPAAMPTR